MKLIKMLKITGVFLIYLTRFTHLAYDLSDSRNTYFFKFKVERHIVTGLEEHYDKLKLEYLQGNNECW